MTHEQWARLKTLFHGALELPVDERESWLARESGQDEMLAREVVALLAAHATVGDFLDAPATIAPADIVEDPPAPDNDLNQQPATAGFPPPPSRADSLGPIAGNNPVKIGSRVGRYEIEHEIARGGMGIVYRARDLQLGRRVALKALPSGSDDNATSRERLRREARAAATISHPSVATVFALEEVDGRLFIASEFIEGHTLRTEIDQGEIERNRAISIAADIARALCAAHDAGVVHRDLKPENVMITVGGAVKVVDFGIAYMESAAATRMTRPGAAIGTPAYMAPEQLVGATADARADIYALGIILAEMLTGHHPLSPGRRPTPLSADAAIVERCIQPDPRARYLSARDLLGALEDELHDRHERPDPPRWWWQFHQVAAAFVYALMTWPTWLARGVIGGAQGNVMFTLALTGAIVAAILRLHLWFSSRHYPAELEWARGRTAAWLLLADGAFSVALIASGVLVGDSSSALAVTQMAVGVGIAVAFLFIEPATARAAFRGSAPQ